MNRTERLYAIAEELRAAYLDDQLDAVLLCYNEFASAIAQRQVTVPLLPISSSTTPFQASRPASVTTNDGTPTLVMISPCRVPIAAPAISTIAKTMPVGSSLPSGVSRIASGRRWRSPSGPVASSQDRPPPRESRHDDRPRSARSARRARGARRR